MLKKDKTIAKNLFLIILLLTVSTGIFLETGIDDVQAVSGQVYTCKINRRYAHPVTGIIEDSGGKASQATGQGMVEGCVYPTGILEATADGKFYLTVKMSLINHTARHNFQVQKVNARSWSKTGFGVTKNGKDKNGKTSDICMQVPSENCIVRGSMYVKPMGRTVIFYFYPSSYRAGNKTGMRSTIVTSTAGGSSGNVAGNTGGNIKSTVRPPVSSNHNNSVKASDAPLKNQDEQKAAENDSSGGGGIQNSLGEEGSAGGSTDSGAQAGQNQQVGEGDSVVNSSKGLALSTASNETGTVTGSDKTNSKSSDVSNIIAWVSSITVAILVIMGACSGIVYVFRRNWKRWGGGDDDYGF